MASGSTAMLRKAAQNCLCQASTEHFEQCAEFPLLRNRGLGPLAVTVLASRTAVEPHLRASLAGNDAGSRRA